MNLALILPIVSGLPIAMCNPTLQNIRICLPNLNPETRYYVRAFAINEAGISYGAELSFTTLTDLSGVKGTVTDIDGNSYKTISIGTQVWMTENLKTTRFNDGSTIPLVTDPVIWSNLTTPGYCWYNNDEASYKNIYGALYNWYTVNTVKLCPAGWHVPTDDEWILIESFLGGGDIAAIRMKEAGFDHWKFTNSSHTANNESGFTSLPSGLRIEDGTFHGIAEENFFWASVSFCGLPGARYRTQAFDGDFNFAGCLSAKKGGSVRCVKD